ncbi:O-Antigen ligase [Stieleria maiorica]|uniref:O-Antigen ligase n=1 Tax=Stieleria maiorica TaxID=2795974 RepID=A0A5B9MFE8_9BACT|nr:O-Antigen ligase [Stieleria maiorica]
MTIGVAGPAVAMDYGGVLHWTHFVAALAIFCLGVPVTLLASSRENLTGIRQLVPFVPVLLWVGYSWLQCVPLDASIVHRLSPGSYSAYTDWLAPILPEEGVSRSFPISIAPDHSRHASAVFTLILAFLCYLPVVCRERVHVTWLLILLGAGIGLHAAYGITGALANNLNVPGGAPYQAGFGTYINRNNVAFLLNIGFACGLALVVSRLKAITAGDGPMRSTLDYSSLGLLASDRIAWFGAATLVICVAGVLLCGSRSGVIAVLVGGMSTYLWFHRRDGWLTIPVAIVVTCWVALLAALILTPFAGSLASIDEFAEFDRGNQHRLLDDPRFQHWPEGIRAALHYLPAGAGIATYSYAYLPYQSGVAEDWFHHADNLWLELLVEQGIAGVIFLAAVVGILIRALLRLSHSTDPVDSGLLAACAYMLGSIAWSETFDFGLVIPGNLVSVATLLGIVVVRSQSAALTSAVQAGSAKAPVSVEFVGVKRRVLSCLTLGVLTTSVGLCLPGLRRDAVDEYLLQSIASQLSAEPSSAESLNAQLSTIASARIDQPTPELLDLVTRLNRTLARLKLVAAINPTSADELNEALQSTKVDQLRKRWYGVSGEMETLPDEYRSAVASARRSLQRLPLGIVARENLVSLDFAHQNRSHSAHALVQLAELQKNSADRSARLAELASAGGDEPLAAQLWRHCTSIDPGKTRQALGHAMADPNRDISRYIADLAICQRFVAGYLLDNPNSDRSSRDQALAFLNRAIEHLDCEACTRIDERSRCEEVAGGILLVQGKAAAALPHFDHAVRLTPTDIPKRRRIIQRLIEAGLDRDAFELATSSYAELPEHYPFKVIADSLATDAGTGQEHPK